MVNAEAIMKAVMQSTIEAAKAVVMTMTEANKGSRMPITGMRQSTKAEAAKKKKKKTSGRTIPKTTSIQLDCQIQACRAKAL